MFHKKIKSKTEKRKQFLFIESYNVWQFFYYTQVSYLLILDIIKGLKNLKILIRRKTHTRNSTKKNRKMNSSDDSL